ncbi:MAG: MFS transporter [Rubrivivax sp.]
MRGDIVPPNFTALHGVLLASLYFSQGLPSGFLAQALPALAAEHGVPVQYIGLLKLLALPWFLKFLWAPLIDRRPAFAPFHRAGAHRGWILLLQSVVIALLLTLALVPQKFLFGPGLVVFVLISLAINLAASTQDIATDGLAVRLLPESLRGLGNSLQVSGYKLGMILSGNLLLIALPSLGWSTTFQALAALLLLATVPVWLFREPPRVRERAAADGRTAPPTQAYWKDGFAAFMARPGMGLWLTVLLTYKIADSYGSAMIKPLLVHSGHSLEQVGTISLAGMVAGMIAAFVAGGIYYRLGWRVSLLLFGLLQALGLGAYALVAAGLASQPQVVAIAVFEQVADAMSTVALFALMMRYCRDGHEGGDYTLQACLHMVVAGVLAMASGFVVQRVGYVVHFSLALGVGLLALVPVAMLCRQGAPRPAATRANRTDASS